ncbi:MAG: lysophospholipid acyltransferase family protein [Cyclobacteriaceae bacterium]
MRLVYYLILRPLSLLPSYLLYRISDFMFLILYRMVGYRKKVVRNNLQNSFPEYSAQELLSIEEEFYSHFCDLIVESIKAFTISREELEKRFVQRNPELFQKYYDNGQHVTLVGGHSGNWEFFAVSIAMHLSHQPVALYSPLHNEFINGKILKSRSKFGLWMKGYAEVKLLVLEEIKPVTVIFGSDQSPNITQQPYWTVFLNQETGVQFGTEKFARDNDAPVIYGFIHKVFRGHYEVEYKLVCEHPNELPLGEISEKHTRMLEEDIRLEPAYWLWSHKRWKRKKIDFENYQNEITANVTA